MAFTIHSFIEVEQKKWKVFELLKRMDEFPRYIAGVESVNSQKISEQERLTKWKINFEGVAVCWVQKDTLIEEEYTLHFQMVEGDFAAYEGKWKVFEGADRTILEISILIDWKQIHLSRETEESLNRKAKLAIRWMLRELRKNIGAENIISIWPLIDLKTPIISERIQYSNKLGKTIIGYYDHLQMPVHNSVIIVIPPGYGETKRDALSISYYLAKNGFAVVRYDATDHVGESDGDMIDITLTKQKDDLLATLDYLDIHFNISCFALVASSLANLVSIKTASLDPRVCFLVGIVPVFNLQATLKAVYNEDMIADVAAGRGQEKYEVLGFYVSQEYHRSAIRDNFHNLSTTIADLQKLKIPVVFFVAEKDAWVNVHDVKLAVESIKGCSNKEVHVVKDAMHQLFENPDIAKNVIKQAVQKCKQYLAKTHVDIDELVEPSLREIAVQNRFERDRLKKRVPLAWAEENKFWNRYLFQFQLIQKFPDFKELLDAIVRLLDISDKDIVSLLDAGCGVGHFGAWLIEKLLNTNHSLQLKYLGLDFVESGIQEARKRHSELLSYFNHAGHFSTVGEAKNNNSEFLNYGVTFNPDESPDKNNLMTKSRFHYTLADLNYQLPFHSNSFDRVCCSLVLSYLQNPSTSLNELVRVLKPNGRIVISSLKPYADISQIYRNFISKVDSEEDVIEARKLLSCAGAIKQREGVGHYYFFSEKSLKDLMKKAGLICNENFRVFGNQANVIVGIKPPNK